MVAVVWQVDIRAGVSEEFEHLYGADGAWTKLSRRSRSFLGTSFLRDMGSETRYLLIEYWGEMVVYEKHLADFSDEVTEAGTAARAAGRADGDDRRVHRPRRAGPGRADLVAPLGKVTGQIARTIPFAVARLLRISTRTAITAGSGTRLATTRIGANEYRSATMPVR